MIEATNNTPDSRPGMVASTYVPTPITRRNIWIHHNTHPITLNVLLLEEYGLKWTEWGTETLWTSIIRDMNTSSIADVTKDKIQAIRSLYSTDRFWGEWEVFSYITQALNNSLPDWQVIVKPSLSQLLTSLDMANMVRKDMTLSLEVQGFIAAAVMDAGVFFAPPPMHEAQDELDTLGEHLKVLDYAKTRDGVADKFPKIIKLSDAAWLAAPKPILEENAVDVQVAKLKVAWDYMMFKRGQLTKQLKGIK